MTYLQQLLEAHPEFVLACEADRARLVQAFAVEFPIDHMTAVLLGSTTAVLKVARAEGAIVSTANMLELAERVTRNSVQTVIAMLLDVNPPRITREDLQVACSADAVARARVRAHAAEDEAIELRYALEQARAEIALLRQRAADHAATYIVPEQAIRS
jgi:hypothetical protein